MSNIVPFPTKPPSTLTTLLQGTFPIERTPENLMALAREAERMLKEGIKDEDVNCFDSLLNRLK